MFCFIEQEYHGQTPKCFDHVESVYDLVESVYDLVELGITSIPQILIAVTLFFIHKSLPANMIYDAYIINTAV